jgi:hypothetical protein
VTLVKPLQPDLFHKFVIPVRNTVNSIKKRQRLPPETPGQPELQTAGQELEDLLVRLVLRFGLGQEDAVINNVVALADRKRLYDDIIDATVAANPSWPVIHRETDEKEADY